MIEKKRLSEKNKINKINSPNKRKLSMFPLAQPLPKIFYDRLPSFQPPRICSYENT